MSWLKLFLSLIVFLLASALHLLVGMSLLCHYCSLQIRVQLIITLSAKPPSIYLPSWLHSCADRPTSIVVQNGGAGWGCPYRSLVRSLERLLSVEIVFRPTLY
ncbi:hypothetical protein F5Y01DRAFT_270095 [Xylaria sp. FL0043]|nr:hypothetical protein F5Y01DRAFT_270095 [Xylaria sp. FL0043]